MERKNPARKLLEKFIDVREAGVLMPLLLAVLLFALKSDKFLSVSNMTNVMRTAAFTIITSIGQAFLIIAGSWDISVGAVFSVGGVAAAAMMSYYGCAHLAGGARCARDRRQSSASLTAFSCRRSSCRRSSPPWAPCMLRAASAPATPRAFRSIRCRRSFSAIGQGGIKIGSYELPYVIVIALVMAVIAGLILRYTAYGRKLFAAGGNGEAARLAGIPTVRIRFSAFVLTGILAALTGVLMASRVGSAQPNIGSGFEMTVVAACVIGGINMEGGAGSIVGVVMGSVSLWR